jgi:hypothetical protein
MPSNMAVAKLARDRSSGPVECPASVATSEAPMGSIIIAVAVLLIHMPRSAVAIIAPATSRLGRVPARMMIVSAMRRWRLHRCMASAIQNPPRKRKISGPANGSAAVATSATPSNGRRPSGSTAVAARGRPRSPTISPSRRQAPRAPRRAHRAPPAPAQASRDRSPRGPRTNRLPVRLCGVAASGCARASLGAWRGVYSLTEARDTCPRSGGARIARRIANRRVTMAEIG